MALQHFLISCALIYTASYCSAVYRTLLLLERGSGHSIDNLWSQQVFNDANGNKSLATFGDLKTGGTFKANIDPTWGTATKIEIVYLNEYGNQLQRFALNVSGMDINVLSQWFQTSSFIFALEPVVADKQLQDRSGINEFIVKSSTTGQISAIVYHEHAAVDPTIMLAVNSSTTMVAATTSSAISLGCYAYHALTLTLSFTNATGMTVAACLSSCTTNISAIQTADRCYCVTSKAQTTDVAPVHCGLSCPGDENFCGGIVVGYYSVYSGTVQSAGTLTTLTVSQETLLTINHTGGSEHVIHITDVLNARDWGDKILYFNGVAVDATNSSGDRILYSIEFSQDLNNFTRFQPDGNKFVTNGSIVDTSIRLEAAVKIVYAQTVDVSTIMLYGPPANSYVDVAYMVIKANFQETSSTTSPSDPNTTQSTPTMEIPLTDLYNFLPDMTIYINGTLYCPCNGTNTTFYPPLTSVYDNTNLTFEERLEDLAVDADALSSNTRRYESAKDDRPSAKTMGTFGILTIIGFVSFIVYLDSTTLVVQAKRLKKNIKLLRKNWISKTKVQSIQLNNRPDDIPIPDILK